MVMLSSDVKAEMAKVAERHSTISGKIRALGDAGYSTADIARYVERSYQQVRQVREAEKMRRARQKAESSDKQQGAAMTHAPSRISQPGSSIPAASAPFRMVVEPDGQLTIPPAVVHAMGLDAGDVVVGRLRDGEFVLIDGRTAMRRAQDFVRSLGPANVSLVDELIADRRREAEERERG